MGVIEQLARGFFDASVNGRFSGDLGFDLRRLSLDEAYEVQEAAADLKERAGMTRAGWKVGCTSPAIRRQLGLNQPIRAPMYRPLIHRGGTSLKRADFLNPAVEPELVICLGSDIREPPLQPQGLLEAVEWVAPGIELHNKRFFFDPPCIQELVAGGGLWAGLVVGGTRTHLAGIDLAAARFTVLMDGRPVAEAPGRDIMGGPLVSLLWLARHLSQQGRPLLKGDLVIPGSPTELIPIDRPALVTVEISGLGRVEASFH